MRRGPRQFPDEPHAPDWLRLLRSECQRTSISAVGGRIGYARTSVSLVCHNRYPGPTDAIELAVAKHLGGMHRCPHLKRSVTDPECASAGSGPMPTSNPDRFRHWTACQTCHHNPSNKEQTP